MTGTDNEGSRGRTRSARAHSPSEEITSIYGFGTPAPEYLLTDHVASPVGRPGTRTRSASRGRNHHYPSAYSPSPDNPLAWLSTPPPPPAGSDAAASASRRARSVPPPRRRAGPRPVSHLSGAAVPLVDDSVPTHKHRVVPRGTSGPSPFSLADGEQATDPLSVVNKRGEVLYVPAGRRVKRAVSAVGLRAGQADGAGAGHNILTWS
ncbi:hypothetical protein AMAG_15581 [Allomyces macrogynus ATCC 38327]|uniref:Uncharacterized protein n=1 Tax=Allomyces macrogynus (strain ATCC 38327) TaxID=578462 RepID=A0A0L0T9C1_ALLM3|nr:hypothetical protein AMAG_15581 [Allomyces macrogynus ATCC 38327]|eukprot:KNE71347.1 hypothetical protein AMAG_15581 [Allomyces macrogynus ATCC 38327]